MGWPHQDGPASVEAMAGLLGRRDDSKEKETCEGRTRVSSEKASCLRYLQASQAVVSRSSSRGVEEII
jgi:hypothetical protein